MKKLLKFIFGTVVMMTADGREFTGEEKAWWAVQPLVEEVVPEEGHPLDFFVGRKLGEAELEVAGEASAEEFVRRASFDLHGLPPTREQVREFSKAWKADRDKAVAGLIDGLLNSSRYGERWGQHWLDVVRYADSDGYRADDLRPTAYRYRDYVIRAFNEDKPYDEFVREQLAGDEIAPGDPEVVSATGFLRHGVYEWNQRNAEMQREIMINEITNVTGEVFLGMGVGCAQCHDHKFDPILQKDYFALQAFLSSTYWPDDRYYATPGENADYEKKRAAWEEATAGIRGEMKALISDGEKKIHDGHVKTFPPEVQEMFAKPWAEQSSYERQISFLVKRQAVREVKTRAKPEQILKKGSAELARYEELKAELVAFDGLKPARLPGAFVSTDTGKEAAEVRMEGKVIEPEFLEILGGGKPEITVREATTGRRTALADWIARKDHPTTARVMVNRIWHHHFGHGLADSPNDFGMLGEKPSHPQLLDWLATDFIKGGWRMKRMHRLIMTSQAYRRTARFEPSHAHEVKDPDNKLLWRFPPKRLSAEQIRDAMLFVSGELKHRDGGPAQGGSTPVRSIYVKKMRNTPERVLHCFDSPSGFASEPARLTTTTATQSLLLSNSEWPLTRARAMARRLLEEKTKAGSAEVSRAFEEAWVRGAEDDEISAAMAFLKRQRELARGTEDVAPGGKGLVEIGSAFKGAEEYLGNGLKGALELDEKKGRGRLVWSGPGVGMDQFSVVAVARLDEIHRDAKVNTLAAQWNGDQQKVGWTVGVTSAASGYGARNLIAQVVGRNPGGDMEYEVVASGLTVPLKAPVLIAVTFDPPSEGRGVVRFWLQDLSKADAVVQTAEVGLNVEEGISRKSGKLMVGARNGGNHYWKGKVARLQVTEGVLEQVGFSEDSIAGLAVTGKGRIPEGWQWAEAKDDARAVDEAFVDFCHALLSSNEFLYLH